MLVAVKSGLALNWQLAALAWEVSLGEGKGGGCHHAVFTTSKGVVRGGGEGVRFWQGGQMPP